jgi:hypothetical protein
MFKNVIVTQSGKPESGKFNVVEKLDFRAFGGTPHKAVAG